jgi:hypothetical protein
MMPQRWMALGQLPRNANGKTDRPILRRQFEQEAPVVEQEMERGSDSTRTELRSKSPSLVR